MMEPLLYSSAPHVSPQFHHATVADNIYKLNNSSSQMPTSPSIAIPSTARQEQVCTSLSPSPLSSSSSSSASSSPDPSPSTSPVGSMQLATSPPLTVGPLAIQFKKRKRGRPPLEKDSRYCSNCGTNSTPEWRKGPNGPHTLCNACGLQFMKAQKRERQAKDKQSIFRVLNGEATRLLKRTVPPASSDPMPKSVECPELDSLALLHQPSLHNNTLLETLQAMNCHNNSLGSMTSLSNSMGYGSMSSLGSSMTLAHSVPVHHSQEAPAHHFPMPLNDLFHSPRVHIPLQHSHQVSQSPPNGSGLDQQLHHFQQLHHMQQLQQYQQLQHFHQLQQMQFFSLPPSSGNGHM